jgi:hypothetical protein
MSVFAEVLLLLGDMEAFRVRPLIGVEDDDAAECVELVAEESEDFDRCRLPVLQYF